MEPEPTTPNNTKKISENHSEIKENKALFSNKIPNNQDADISPSHVDAAWEEDAEELAKRNRHMYWMRITQNINTRLEKVQQHHIRISNDIKQLIEEARRLQGMIRKTRADLMVQSDDKYG